MEILEIDWDGGVPFLWTLAVGSEVGSFILQQLESQGVGTIGRKILFKYDRYYIKVQIIAIT